MQRLTPSILSHSLRIPQCKRYNYISSSYSTFNSTTPSLSPYNSNHQNIFLNKKEGYWYGVKTTNKYFHSTSVLCSSKIQPFLLTDVGEGIAEVEVLSFLVKEGDMIEEFEPVCEVQSDKASTEITSRYEGKVVKVYYKKGDIAKVGLPLIDVEIPDKTTSTAPSTSSSSSDSKSSTPKTTSSSPSSELPKEKESSHHDENRFSVEIRSSYTQSGKRRVLATPAVRRIASEKNISITNIQGTGKDGRVTKGDVLQAQSSKQSESTTSSTQTNTFSMSTEDREVPIRGYGRAMVKTMTLAAKVPHFGYSDEIQVDELLKLKNSIQNIVEENSNTYGKDLKITVMPIFIKALSCALKSYPILNSQFKEESMSLIYKGSHNIGVAMDTPSGLVVPNIKNCQNKSIVEIAQDLSNLINLAKDNKLSVEHLTGGTITLSNVGTIGGTYTSPVLNLPEVAIGALGKIQKLPRYDSEGNVSAVQIVQLSWSADHRVLDGATVARFSTLFKNYIENPICMLMESR